MSLCTTWLICGQRSDPVKKTWTTVKWLLLFSYDIAGKRYGFSVGWRYSRFIYNQISYFHVYNCLYLNSECKMWILVKRDWQQQKLKSYKLNSRRFITHGVKFLENTINHLLIMLFKNIFVNLMYGESKLTRCNNVCNRFNQIVISMCKRSFELLITQQIEFIVTVSATANVGKL